MADGEKIAAAAKAAFPELWPAEDAYTAFGRTPPFPPGELAYLRQDAVDRIIKAIEVLQQPEAAGEDSHEAGPIPLADFTIEMPDDAAMIQQVLTTITYIDNDGRTAYVVRTMGEGLRTSWLGMCVLTQDYILRLT